LLKLFPSDAAVIINVILLENFYTSFVRQV